MPRQAADVLVHELTHLEHELMEAVQRHDTERLDSLIGREFKLVWREHCVVAVLDQPSAAAGKLADKGFEIISFEGEAWAEPFARLGKALGL